MSSVRPPEVVGLTGSDRQRVSGHEGRHKEDKIPVDPVSQDTHQSAPPPSCDLSRQELKEQMSVLSAHNAEKPQHDNLEAPGQAPTGTNGYFNNAHDLAFYQPVMININETEEKVLRWLSKFTMSGAEFDASGHVPGCHPGTRIAILEMLQHWVYGTEHGRRMVWLYGPAGVGKSAILQSLAERLSGASRLGATLFFSRPNGRYNPTFVLPTIIFQLAVRIPLYKEYVKQLMMNNPKLLEKDMERQFQALIVEPFTQLGLTAEGGKWVVLLDGLDECQGENAQALIVKLISRFTRQHPTAPLVWVIASRPEAHLQVVFNSEEVRGSFEEQEVLANSDDACRDVEKFLRAKFGEVRQNYKDLIPTDVPWPGEQDIARVSTTSSGLFALAATIVHYVDDPDACDPISQLATVLSVTKGLEPGSLSALYTLYSTILAGVPQALSSILNLVLTFYTAFGRDSYDNDDGSKADDYPLVLFATIFGLQQHTVYGALRKLHSVIKVPPLSESGRLGIKFYHASFSDYLKTLEVYAVDVDTMKKMWRGFVTITYGGDSTVYKDATSNGQPPVPLSWDVKLADSTLTRLWRDGIEHLLHLSLPRCPNTDDGVPDHPHLPLNVDELQDILGSIDFSALIFREEDRYSVLNVLFNLFKWLVSAEAPPELLQSEVVKKVSMRELNFACIPQAKLGHEGEWSREYDGKISLNYSPRRSFTGTLSPQYSHQEWESEVLPFKDLISGLDKLRSEDLVVDVLIIGRQPSGRCALLCTLFAAEEQGSFYYVPYCQ